MPVTAFFTKPTLLTAAALLLAACAVPGFGDDEDVDLACPTLTLLDDAETLTRFATSTSQDLTDLAFEARMANIGGSCVFDVDGPTGPGTVDADLAFAFEIAPGPAMSGNTVTLRYFVAVSDTAGRVLNKATFDVQAALPSGNPRTLVRDEPVHLRIPLKAGEIGTDYHLIAGLQLNQSELEYNRRKQSGRR